MTNKEAQRFHEELLHAIEGVLKKFNLIRNTSNVTYSDTSVRFSMSMDQLDEDGMRKADEYTEMMLHHLLLSENIQNVPEKIIGSRFHYAGQLKTFTICGYNSRAQSYPLLFTDGKKTYKGKCASIVFENTGKLTSETLDGVKEKGKLDRAGNGHYEEMLMREYLTGIGIKDIPKKIIGSKVKLSEEDGVYTIVGYNANAIKYPIMLKSVFGLYIKSSGTDIEKFIT